MKKALIIIGVIVAAILLLALILPSSKRVERSIEINAPIGVVFDQVNDLEKNFNWSPWTAMDPNIEINWGEIRSGVGASYSWKGNDDVGVGQMTIVESIENVSIKNALILGDDHSIMGTWNFSEVTLDDGRVVTNATWGFECHLDWPHGRFFGLMLDNMIGSNYEKGLQTLKEVAESMPVEEKISVEIVDVMEVTMLSIKDSVAMSDIGKRMGELYGEIIGLMQENNLEVKSYPLCLYHTWNEEMGYAVLEAGIPVVKGTKVKLKGNVKMSTIAACNAAKAIHMGAYEKLDKTHYGIDAWVADNGKTLIGSPWEIYVTDPMSEPDTAKWVTEVYYPVN